MPAEPDGAKAQRKARPGTQGFGSRPAPSSYYGAGPGRRRTVSPYPCSDSMRAAAAAAGSGAVVTARPMTRMSAPASSACCGVAARA